MRIGGTRDVAVMGSTRCAGLDSRTCREVGGWPLDCL